MKSEWQQGGFLGEDTLTDLEPVGPLLSITWSGLVNYWELPILFQK